MLDVSRVSSFADYLVICGAESDRQSQAIAMNVCDGLKAKGIRPISVEGMESGRWVLVDYGDVVVHVFLDSVREFYNIEGFWGDAPRLDVKAAVKEKPAAKQKPAVKKRTTKAASAKKK